MEGELTVLGSGPDQLWSPDAGQTAYVCSAGCAAIGGFEGLGDKGSLRRWLQQDTAMCGTRGEVAPGHMGMVQGAMLVLSVGGPRPSFDSMP